jgi:hypothetical protein
VGFEIGFGGGDGGFVGGFGMEDGGGEGGAKSLPNTLTPALSQRERESNGIGTKAFGKARRAGLRDFVDLGSLNPR